MCLKLIPWVTRNRTGLGFLDSMLLPFQAKIMGRDVTKSVRSKAWMIDNEISEGEGATLLITGREIAQKASLFWRT